MEPRDDIGRALATRDFAHDLRCRARQRVSLRWRRRGGFSRRHLDVERAGVDREVKRSWLLACFGVALVSCGHSPTAPRSTETETEQNTGYSLEYVAADRAVA